MSRAQSRDGPCAFAGRRRRRQMVAGRQGRGRAGGGASEEIPRRSPREQKLVIRGAARERLRRCAKRPGERREPAADVVVGGRGHVAIREEGFSHPLPAASALEDEDDGERCCSSSSSRGTLLYSSLAHFPFAPLPVSRSLSLSSRCPFLLSCCVRGRV